MESAQREGRGEILLQQGVRPLGFSKMYREDFRVFPFRWHSKVVFFGELIDSISKGNH